jgi:hypothetical protein
MVLVEENPRPAKPTRGAEDKHLPVHPWSRRLALRAVDQTARRLEDLPALIDDDLEFNLPSFVQHPGAFNRADMHEHVVAAVVRLNETETFFGR